MKKAADESSTPDVTALSIPRNLEIDENSMIGPIRELPDSSKAEQKFAICLKDYYHGSNGIASASPPWAANTSKLMGDASYSFRSKISI